MLSLSLATNPHSSNPLCFIYDCQIAGKDNHRHRRRRRRHHHHHNLNYHRQYNQFISDGGDGGEIQKKLHTHTQQIMLISAKSSPELCVCVCVPFSPNYPFQLINCFGVSLLLLLHLLLFLLLHHRCTSVASLLLLYTRLIRCLHVSGMCVCVVCVFSFQCPWSSRLFSQSLLWEKFQLVPHTTRRC